MNLIIGAAVNYNIKDISTFVKSFRKYNDTDKVILIFNDISNNQILLDFLSKYNIDYITYNSNFSTSGVEVAHNRFKLYEEFLNKNKEFKSILLTDIRDVFFQGNPFENIQEEEFIYFFEEDKNSDIKSEFQHTDWIKKYFGEENYKVFERKQILCSGNTMASTNQMIIYLKKINYYIEDSIKFPFLRDHAFHNWIGHIEKDLFKNISHKENGDVVATIGLTLERSKDLIIMKDDYLYVSNMKPSLVHQYDRSEELVNFINEKYN
jgi:hypothetical protein